MAVSLNVPWQILDMSLDLSFGGCNTQLTNAIYQQNFLDIDEEAQIEIMKGVKHKKNEWYIDLQNTIRI